jgi:cytochrome c-type biogenesis protein CcmH/NrfF
LRRRRCLRARVALAAILGGMLLFALRRGAAAVPMGGTDPQVGAASSMAPHAPVVVPVSPELKKVLEGLLCQCGCNLDAYSCQQTMTCNVSTDMWDQAVLMVDREGKTPEQALEAFAADYGEYVGVANETRVQLVAWALPFTALGLGVVIAIAPGGGGPRPGPSRHRAAGRAVT